MVGSESGALAEYWMVAVMSTMRLYISGGEGGEERRRTQLELIGNCVKHVWIHVSVNGEVGRSIVARGDKNGVSLGGRDGYHAYFVRLRFDSVYFDDLHGMSVEGEVEHCQCYEVER